VTGCSFAIITTTANELCTELHDRMQVVLKPEVWPEWLGEEPADARELKALLAPYPSEEMTCWPVSARVGNLKNNDPSLIEPVAWHGVVSYFWQPSRAVIRYGGGHKLEPDGVPRSGLPPRSMACNCAFRSSSSALYRMVLSVPVACRAGGSGACEGGG
jgi:hypothetical protein